MVSGHGAWVSSVALSANGTVGVTVSGDETGVVWDLHTGAFLKVLEGHSGDVRSVVLTRHGRYTSPSLLLPAQQPLAVGAHVLSLTFFGCSSARRLA